MRIRLSGYQGAASVHTRALHHLSALLRADGFDPEVTEDVTAQGMTARSLFDRAEGEDAHLHYMASGYLTARVPSLGALDLPMTVRDRRLALDALDGEAGRILRADITAVTDLEVLGFWDNGVRHVSSRSGPILSPSDCDGLVIRTLDNALYCATLAAFGFTPVVTDVRELVAAVSEGRVDAQENPLTNTVSFGLHSHHRHVSLTGHIFGIALLLCRREWLSNLPEERRRRIARAAEDTTRMQRIWAEEEDERCLARLRAEGVAVSEPDRLDMGAFRAAAAPVVAQAMQGLSEAILAAYLGPQSAEAAEPDRVSREP